MLRVELAWPDLEATVLSAVWAAVAGGERSGGDREGAEMLFRRRWRARGLAVFLEGCPVFDVVPSSCPFIRPLVALQNSLAPEATSTCN
jgi:hypothetical protein